MNMYVGSERNALGTKRDDNLPLGVTPRGWDSVEAGFETTGPQLCQCTECRRLHMAAAGAGQGKTATVKPTQPTKFTMLVGGKEMALTCDEVERLLNVQRKTIEIMQFTQARLDESNAARLREINALASTIDRIAARNAALEGEKRTAQANASRKLKALQTQLDSKRAEFNALDRWSNIAADALDGVDAVIARAKGTLLAA